MELAKNSPICSALRVFTQNHVSRGFEVPHLFSVAVHKDGYNDRSWPGVLHVYLFQPSFRDPEQRSCQIQKAKIYGG
jgi:hypothetical protein